MKGHEKIISRMLDIPSEPANKTKMMNTLSLTERRVYYSPFTVGVIFGVDNVNPKIPSKNDTLPSPVL